MTKWSNEEVIHLTAMIDALGLANGIKEFRSEHPDRSYNACWSKYKRILSSTDEPNENLSNAATPVNDSIETVATVVKTEEVKTSFWSKICNFIRNLF